MCIIWYFGIFFRLPKDIALRLYKKVKKYSPQIIRKRSKDQKIEPLKYWKSQKIKDKTTLRKNILKTTDNRS